MVVSYLCPRYAIISPSKWRSAIGVVPVVAMGVIGERVSFFGTASFVLVGVLFDGGASVFECSFFVVTLVADHAFSEDFVD